MQPCNIRLFIHGAGGYEDHQPLRVTLRDFLEAKYEIRYPKMPEGFQTEKWYEQLETELAASDEKVILVGHSPGASLLVKYLSKTVVEQSVLGLFLLAPPYWGAAGWDVDEYMLEATVESTFPTELPVFVYHCRDDEIVSVVHRSQYEELLPQATTHVIESGGHQFNSDLSVVAHDIERLEKERS